MRLIEDLFNIIAPHQCLNCQKEGSLLCYDCSLTVRAVPPRCYSCGRWDEAWRTCQACRKRTAIHSLWTVAAYEGVAKELVHRLKFERSRAGAVPIAGLLAERCAPGSDTVVTFIPTASRRIRERGYDQAAVIAKELSARLNLPLVPCLARIGDKRQVGSSRALRKQMDGVFRPLNPEIFRGKHVMIVDDVLTTGATCEAAAKILRQAGAKQVSAAVFAVA